MKNAARPFVIAFILMMAFSTSCRKGGAAAGDKYADVKETASRYVSLIETCAREVEAAAEGGAIASAIDKMNDGLQSVAPKLVYLGKQFPELNDPAGVPDELKPFKERMDAVRPILKAAIKKAESFDSDPVVQLALGRFAEIQKVWE